MTKADLEKLRDKEARDCTGNEGEGAFKSGFDTALELLWPCVEALKQYADDNNWTIDAVENGFGCDFGGNAKITLAELEGKLNNKEEV